MQELLKRYPELEGCAPAIQKVLELMLQTYKKGGKILLCGNGGSCADCEHIVGELMKGFLSKRKMTETDRNRFVNAFGESGDYFADRLQYGIPAVVLTAHSGLISAFANDVSPELVFAQQVWGLGTEQDLLIGLSCSGNSENIIRAMQTARVKNMRVAGLTGEMPCKMDEVADSVAHVPEKETYKVQELHLPVYHYLCAALEKKLFGGISDEN